MRRRASFISAPVVFTHSCRMASARIAIDWHSELFSELNLKPWEWPAVRAPNTACPEEPGSLAEAHWRAAVKLLAATPATTRM